jgi:hypothetical protein
MLAVVEFVFHLLIAGKLYCGADSCYRIQYTMEPLECDQLHTAKCGQNFILRVGPTNPDRTQRCTSDTLSCWIPWLGPTTPAKRETETAPSPSMAASVAAPPLRYHPVTAAIGDATGGSAKEAQTLVRPSEAK